MYKIIFTLGLPTDAKVIREEVFMKEQGFEDEFDDLDAISYHAVLYENGQPIGTARTFLQDDIYVIGRVAVIKEKRKQHLGKEIMLTIEEKIKELHGTKIMLSAQTRARGFYETLGYVVQGEEYLDEYCPHIKMIKIVNE
jgi:predicted GNAT family N-acyltransferase